MWHSINIIEWKPIRLCKDLSIYLFIFGGLRDRQTSNRQTVSNIVVKVSARPLLAASCPQTLSQLIWSLVELNNKVDSVTLSFTVYRHKWLSSSVFLLFAKISTKSKRVNSNSRVNDFCFLSKLWVMSWHFIKNKPKLIMVKGSISGLLYNYSKGKENLQKKKLLRFFAGIFGRMWNDSKCLA